MTREIYATTTNPYAIRELRNNVTNYLDPCDDGRDNNGLLYYLTPVDGPAPRIRVSDRLVEFIGTELAFDAIVPLPNYYDIRDAA
jgi:hypothetical protein